MSSNNFYKDGAKFEIIDINYTEKTFVISGVQEFDKSKKLRWGLAKDDVNHHDIFRLTNGSDTDRGIVAKYCIKDCVLCLDLMNKLSIIPNNIGMANVCSVPLSYIFQRGQGIKVFSLVSKECYKLGYVIPELYKSKAVGNYEGAIVLKPKPGIYLDEPIAVLDYSSLYPSSMISHNLSHDTIIVEGSEYADNVPSNREVWTVEYDNYMYIKKGKAIKT